MITVLGGLILWGIQLGIRRSIRASRQAPAARTETKTASEEELELPVEEIEIIAVLAREEPDVVLAESAISRRLNRRLDSPVSRQGLRFHLEQLLELDAVYLDDEESDDDDPYYGLTSFGRECAVAMGLVA